MRGAANIASLHTRFSLSLETQKPGFILFLYNQEELQFPPAVSFGDD